MWENLPSLFPFQFSHILFPRFSQQQHHVFSYKIYIFAYRIDYEFLVVFLSPNSNAVFFHCKSLQLAKLFSGQRFYWQWFLLNQTIHDLFIFL